MPATSPCRDKDVVTLYISSIDIGIFSYKRLINSGWVTSCMNLDFFMHSSVPSTSRTFAFYLSMKSIPWHLLLSLLFNDVFNRILMCFVAGGNFFPEGDLLNLHSCQWIPLEDCRTRLKRFLRWNSVNWSLRIPASVICRDMARTPCPWELNLRLTCASLIWISSDLPRCHHSPNVYWFIEMMCPCDDASLVAPRLPSRAWGLSVRGSSSYGL
ncbi:hypothetical protein Tco_0612819 [Tanacetum coccineum]